MKRILILSGAAMLLLASCTKKPNGVFSRTDNFLGSKLKIEYDFRSDGKFSSDFGGEKASGSWVTQGGAIIATFNDGEKKEFKWEGSDLVLTKSGNDVVADPSRFTKQ